MEGDGGPGREELRVGYVELCGGGVGGRGEREVHPVAVVDNQALKVGGGGESFFGVFWIRVGGLCGGVAFEEPVSAGGGWGVPLGSIVLELELVGALGRSFSMAYFTHCVLSYS